MVGLLCASINAFLTKCILTTTHLYRKGNRHNARGYILNIVVREWFVGSGLDYVSGFIGHRKHCRVDGATIHLRNDIHKRITYIWWWW